MDPRVKYILWRRAQNATFEEIGNELNLSKTMVRELYTAELDRPVVKGKPDGFILTDAHCDKAIEQHEEEAAKLRAQIDDLKRKYEQLEKLRDAERRARSPINFHVDCDAVSQHVNKIVDDWTKRLNHCFKEYGAGD